jgi:hypothetical protein
LTANWQPYFHTSGSYNNAQDLQKTAKAYDDILSAYQKEYENVDIQAKHYYNIDKNYDANQ